MKTPDPDGATPAAPAKARRAPASDVPDKEAFTATHPVTVANQTLTPGLRLRRVDSAAMPVDVVAKTITAEGVALVERAEKAYVEATTPKAPHTA